MHVTFKLSDEERIRALAIAAETKKKTENFNLDQSDYEKLTKRPSDYHNSFVWCGNLLGYQGGHQAFNGYKKGILVHTSPQLLQLTPDGRHITYDGQRIPLFQIGGMHILIRVTGGDPSYHDYERAKSLIVKKYTTYDLGLKWWESSYDAQEMFFFQ